MCALKLSPQNRLMKLSIVWNRAGRSRPSTKTINSTAGMVLLMDVALRSEGIETHVHEGARTAFGGNSFVIQSIPHSLDIQSWTCDASSAAIWRSARASGVG